MSEIKKDRVLGVVLGTAIGDAMGASTEFQTPENWEKQPHREPTLRAGIARYTDDTQMFRAVMEGLMRGQKGELNICATSEEVAEEIVAWSVDPPGGHRAPGGACLYGARRLAEGVSWRHSGKPDAGGCGAAMRSMAYGLLLSPPDAARLAALHARMTHLHPMAAASSAAVAMGVAMLLRGAELVLVASTMADIAWRYHQPTSAMLTQALLRAHEAAENPLSARSIDVDVLDEWRGWAGHEAVAAALYCFLRFPENFECAVRRAVNSPGDSDSLGAIAGAFSGARVGAMAIPDRWVCTIERRDELFNLAERVCSF